MLEAISTCEEIVGKKLNYSYAEQNRSGDHIWYISDVSKFQLHYPKWEYEYSLINIFKEIFNAQTARLVA
ncbi:MAG: hypothetical protein QNJ18_20350 [Xenococcaceae cyanobacterium MO_167.B52]|nr:hypothetical protein [Xenococcaceae cyanobacterium MO_167.B52]